MKKVLVEMLRENGFSEVPVQSEILKNGGYSVFQRSWTREVQTVWHGTISETYKVRVLVKVSGGICHVSYQKDGWEYKERWYDTIGKRTYNAIVETARCAGYEF